MASSPDSRPFIEVRGLKKKIGKQEILRGVNLDVFRGETMALIGPSGEGKSVLLKHLIGLMKPDEGTIKIDGTSLIGLRERQLAPLRKQIGILFQNAALFDSLTLEQNVAFPLYEAGVRDPKEISERVHEALDVVELADHKQKMPVNLSGGMRKRAGIARAIISRPACVLYDEPTSGLDPVVSDVIDQMIMRLRKRYNMTAIVVTHDMKSVFKISSRVAMLKGGVIHFLGTPEELRDTKEQDVQDFIEGKSDITG
jgi:phospholipid/cholesterol/gamma-HCH transport system ATP-binding protein